MQPNAHVTTSMQPMVWHWPQSCGQMAQVSNSSHLPLGQNEQTPQSCLHDEQFSLPEQTPSPQPWHAPQSAGQVKQFSVAALHFPSPQLSHTPQSGAHERQSSGGLQ